MAPLKFTLKLLLYACLALPACAQTNAPQQPAATDLFVGSTPSDSLIMALLQIAPGTPSEFMKWEMRIENRKAATGKFEATVFYGMTKPNTNGFMGNSAPLKLTGTFRKQQGAAGNDKATVYSLQATQFTTPLLLIEMDNNILHFLTPGKRLITGNAGWGYVLNKIQ